jgi:hypothetical protein
VVIEPLAQLADVGVQDLGAFLDAVDGVAEAGAAVAAQLGGDVVEALIQCAR